MFTPNEPRHHESGISGPSPSHWFGVNAVDGDATQFARAPKGSTYQRVDLTNNLSLGTFTKVKEDSHDNDWCEGMAVLSETVALADFTDGGGAVGTYVLKRSIPAGAFVLRTMLVDVTGFAGDTSAVLTIGDGTDVDRYNTGTEDVFSDVVAVDTGAPSGTQIHATAVATVTLTITTAADWGSVTAGSVTVRIYYLG